ncbi:MAG: hypothetical protein ABMA25_06600 [Ilumatobacteraceae bacterium]
MLRSHSTLLRALGTAAVLIGLSGCAKEAVETIQQGETNACASDKKVIEIAVDVYYANGGAAGTATMDGLVAMQLLREPSTSYLVAPDGLTVLPIPGGLCDTAGGQAEPAPEQGGARAFTPEQCEADRVTLQGAVDTFGATYGVSPMSESELVSARLLAAELQGYDLQGSTLVPVPGVCA